MAWLRYIQSSLSRSRHYTTVDALAKNIRALRCNPWCSVLRGQPTASFISEAEVQRVLPPSQLQSANAEDRSGSANPAGLRVRQDPSSDRTCMDPTGMSVGIWRNRSPGRAWGLKGTPVGLHSCRSRMDRTTPELHWPRPAQDPLTSHDNAP